MKQLFTLITVSFFGSFSFSQVTHQVCIAEVFSTGACNSSSGVFTPGNLTIAVGDQIQFTTHMILLGGYNGTHNIQFTGSPANNVNLTISTNLLAPVTTVTTPPFMTPGIFPMACGNSNHCVFAEFLEGWACTGYSVTVVGAGCTTDASFTSTATTICAGTTVNFTNTSTSATDYSWKIDEVEFAVSSNSSYLFSTPGTYEIELLVTDGGTCLDSVTTTIAVEQPAEAGTDNSTSLCNVSGTTIDLNSLLSGNNATGVWAETSSSGQFNSSTGIFDVSGLTSGDYTFTYTVSAVAPCPDDVANFIVTVNQNPSIDLNLSTTSIFLGDSIYIDFTSSGAIGGTAYDWDFCDGNSASAAAPFYYEWNSAGTALCVCVEMDNNNGCVDSDCENAINVIDASGINELTQSGILVYPNPTSGNFTIDFSKVNQPILSVSITDNSGRIIRSYANISGTNLLIEREDIAKGLYHIAIETENQNWVFPVIME